MATSKDPSTATADELIRRLDDVDRSLEGQLKASQRAGQMLVPFSPMYQGSRLAAAYLRVGQIRDFQKHSQFYRKAILHLESAEPPAAVTPTHDTKAAVHDEKRTREEEEPTSAEKSVPKEQEAMELEASHIIDETEIFQATTKSYNTLHDVQKAVIDLQVSAVAALNQQIDVSEARLLATFPPSWKSEPLPENLKTLALDLYAAARIYLLEANEILNELREKLHLAEIASAMEKLASEMESTNSSLRDMLLSGSLYRDEVTPCVKELNTAAESLNVGFSDSPITNAALESKLHQAGVDYRKLQASIGAFTSEMASLPVVEKRKFKVERGTPSETQSIYVKYEDPGQTQVASSGEPLDMESWFFGLLNGHAEDREKIEDYEEAMGLPHLPIARSKPGTARHFYCIICREFGHEMHMQSCPTTHGHLA